MSATLDRMLEKAAEALAAGDLARAERLSREALERDPRDPHALQLAAAVRLQQADGARASVAGDSSSSRDWLERARRLRQQGALAEAIEASRCALERAPRDAQAWTELAHVLRWQNRLEAAHDAATRAIAIDPALAGAWFNLGAVRVERGEIARGIEAYRKALELEPDFAEAWSNLGEALGATGDPAGEIDAYRRAAGIDSQLAPVWSNLGNALLEAGEVEEAVAACGRAIALEPDYAAAWNNLGNALRERGEHAEAIRACERAIELAPQLAQAWSNLGCALLEQGDTEQSLAAHRRALALGPRIARVHYNMGLAHERCGQHEAAAGSYRRTVAIDPAFAAAGVRLACALLTDGNFAQGWPEYEWRWREKDACPRRYDFTPWPGAGAPGRLLLWGEQGIGDEIIYSSMIGELANAGQQVTLEIDARLVAMMRRSLPGVRVVARADPPAIDPAAFDWQCPLGSLGARLRPSFSSFPRHAGYLRPDAERAQRLSTELRGPGASRLVGISWSSAHRKVGSAKSIALTAWADILKQPGIRFVNLQYGDTREDRDALRRQHGLALAHRDDVDLLHDLEGLAALCAACDLIITASNVTAHMAGALGKPVWLLAPTGNGRLWYWFSGRADSPWYPSMRIFEQARPGQWQPVLDAVARALAEQVSGAWRMTPGPA